MAAVKLNGASWKAFFADPAVWTDGAWLDDDVIHVDGKLTDNDTNLADVADTAEVVVESGSFYATSDAEGADLLGVIRRWLKQQTTSHIVFEVPKGREDEARAALKALFSSQSAAAGCVG